MRSKIFEKKHLQKINFKNENFEISGKIRKFSRKNIFCFSMKIVFDQKYFSEKNIDHLFRSQISQRFQKSYLENCAISLPTLHKDTVRKTGKCGSYYDLYNGGFTCTMSCSYFCIVFGEFEMIQLKLTFNSPTIFSDV